MSIDIHLELGETISEAMLRERLAAGGATLDEGDDPAAFSGEFPDSGMAFFYDAYAAPRPLRAEHATTRPMIASKLWLRPTTEAYEAAVGELRALVVSLAESGGDFVLSHQYERILAECAGGGLTLFPPLVR